MLTPIQQVMLTCLFLEPEDKTAFKKLRTRAWRNKNPARVRSYRLSYYQKNRTQQLEYSQKWKKENPQRVLDWRRTNPDYPARYIRHRRASDPEFRLLCALQGRLRDALRGRSKAARTVELLGCSVAELWAHLEKQFRPGMTRGNHGSVWHVDHKRPCASFDLTDHAQQRECFHYTNLQPLFAEENLKKGAKYVAGA